MAAHERDLAWQRDARVVLERLKECASLCQEVVDDVYVWLERQRRREPTASTACVAVVAEALALDAPLAGRGLVRLPGFPGAHPVTGWHRGLRPEPPGSVARENVPPPAWLRSTCWSTPTMTMTMLSMTTWSCRFPLRRRRRRGLAPEPAVRQARWRTRLLPPRLAAHAAEAAPDSAAAAAAHVTAPTQPPEQRLPGRQ